TTSWSGSGAKAPKSTGSPPAPVRDHRLLCPGAARPVPSPAPMFMDRIRMTLSRLAAPALLCLAIAAALPGAARAQAPLTTHAERSGFLETGRYPEVIELCEAFATRYPDAVRCTDFGTTPQGRPMKALVVSQSGAFTPEQARERGLPVTLIQ